MGDEFSPVYDYDPPGVFRSIVTSQLAYLGSLGGAVWDGYTKAEDGCGAIASMHQHQSLHRKRTKESLHALHGHHSGISRFCMSTMISIFPLDGTRLPWPPTRTSTAQLEPECSYAHIPGGHAGGYWVFSRQERGKLRLYQGNSPLSRSSASFQNSTITKAPTEKAARQNRSPHR